MYLPPSDWLAKQMPEERYARADRDRLVKELKAARRAAKPASHQRLHTVLVRLRLIPTSH